MMNEEKTDLILKLIDGEPNAEERRNAELALLTDEELRVFYTDQMWLHQQLSSAPVTKAPNSLVNRISKNLAPNILVYHLDRMKQLKLSLIFNVVVLISIAGLMMYFYTDSSILPELYNVLPMEYIIKVGLICIAISSLLYLDKLYALKKNVS